MAVAERLCAAFLKAASYYIGMKRDGIAMMMMMMIILLIKKGLNSFAFIFNSFLIEYIAGDVQSHDI
jgi:hypothetical protein